MNDKVAFKGKVGGVAHRASVLLQREREVVPQETDPCLEMLYAIERERAALLDRCDMVLLDYDAIVRQILRDNPAPRENPIEAWPEPFIPEGDDGA